MVSEDKLEVKEKKKLLKSIKESKGLNSDIGGYIQDSKFSRRRFLRDMGLVTGAVTLGAMGIGLNQDLITETDQEETQDNDQNSENSAFITGKATNQPTSSEYTSQEHTIEFENTGSEPVNNYFKVASS